MYKLSLCLSFILSFFAFQALGQELARCYPLSTTQASELCVPAISSGNRLLISVQNSSDITQTNLELSNLFKKTSTLNVLLKAESKGEDFLLKQNPNKTFLPISNLLGKVENLFNQAPNFGGPNCYHTALMVTNGAYSPELRYVSPEEFELSLKLGYDKVTNPEFGDIVVYEATGERGHAAVFIADGIVFHKKSYLKGYIYRLAQIDEVAKKELYEWSPRPDSQSGPALEGMSTKEKAYYRKKPNPLQLDQADSKELKRIALIDEIGKQVVIAAPQWKVGAYLGLVVERLTEDLASEYRDMEKNPSTAVQMSYARLLSYRDQVFQSLEDSYFSSPLSSNRIDRIREEFCYVDTPQFRAIVEKLLTAYGKETTPENINKFMKSLQATDKKACKVSLIDLATY